MAAVLTYGSTSNCLTSPANFAGCLSTTIVNPILGLVFAIALLVFIWGVVEYVWGLSTKANDKEEGKQHMLWGVIGMFIMVAAWAILGIIINTIGPSSTIHLQ